VKIITETRRTDLIIHILHVYYYHLVNTSVGGLLAAPPPPTHPWVSYTQ